MEGKGEALVKMRGNGGGGGTAMAESRSSFSLVFFVTKREGAAAVFVLAKWGCRRLLWGR